MGGAPTPKWDPIGCDPQPLWFPLPDFFNGVCFFVLFQSPTLLANGSDPKTCSPKGTSLRQSIGQLAGFGLGY